ncbi:MAG: glycosyltransferase [Verrucomicrobiota bacterium]
MIAASVVMPVHNSASTIKEALASIQNQTEASIEIIVVDHLSTDTTPELLKEAQQQDSRIKVLHHSGTFVEAANLAWRHASGPLIARMDADDVAMPSRIEAQVEFLHSRPHLAACGSLVAIKRRGSAGETLTALPGYQRYERWVNSVVSEVQIQTERFVDSPIPNPSSMMRREVLEALGGYRETPWAEDYDFWLRMIAAGYPIAKVNLSLLDWYDSETRATRNIPRYELSRFQEAKAHFLAKIPLLQELGVCICGAGPIGKELVSLLRHQGVSIKAFFEVNERQIGNQINGIPVLPTAAMADLRGKTVLLAAVGQVGARERIRKLIEPLDFEEGKDFFCVA